MKEGEVAVCRKCGCRIAFSNKVTYYQSVTLLIELGWNKYERYWFCAECKNGSTAKFYGSLTKIYRVTCHDCGKQEEITNPDVPDFRDEIVYLLIQRHWKFFKVDGWHCPKCTGRVDS